MKDAIARLSFLLVFLYLFHILAARPSPGATERKRGDIMQQAPENLPNTYFVIGESRTNADNAITKIYGSFYVAFEVDGETEEVLAFQCTHTLGLTEEFLRQWFIGQSFPQIGDWLEQELERRYGGSSRRAVLTAYRDALKRYRAMRRGGE